MSTIDLCDRLSAETGIDFKISEDTRDPVGHGQFGYWVTTYNDGYELVAFTTIFHDEVFSGKMITEKALIARINKLEAMV